ncbi:acetyltransferase [Brevibacillus agri]
MKRVIILGGGDHARIVAEVLMLQGYQVAGYTDVTDKGNFWGIRYLGDDSVVKTYSAEKILLANGLGSIGDNSRRKQLYLSFKEKGYSFVSAIHPNAVLSPHVIVEEGVQIMAGAVIQAGTKLGSNTIVNTRASVDHDCVIEEHVHIAPGATISGGVTVRADSHIGTGAVIIQGIVVGKSGIVGAGAVVIRDVPEQAKVVGVPAKRIGTCG